MATFGLERFAEVDNANGIGAVPLISNSANVVVPQLNNTDILTDLEFYFQFKGSTNAYTGTGNLSPYFPYLFVQNIKVPYQSNSVSAVNMDGHLAWIISVLRGDNRKHMVNSLLGDQKPALTTGYSPSAQQWSSGGYTLAPSTAETYGFRLRIPTALYFSRFYDTDNQGKLGAIDDVYVSPLFMQSIGRSITPVVTLNPVNSTRYDRSPIVQTGSLTTPITWTDTGSTLTVRRNGFRQPGAGSALPPAFNWAYNWTVDQVNIGSSKVSYTFPLQGQLLCVVVKMFDPTLNAGAGGVIPLANLSSAVLSYGAGIAKYQDVPGSLQDRMIDQQGVILTEGVFLWDMYDDTRSNLDAINTYTTASVKLSLDFGGNTPGAGSYLLVASEWLTQVG